MTDIVKLKIKIKKNHKKKEKYQKTTRKGYNLLRKNIRKQLEKVIIF